MGHHTERIRLTTSDGLHLDGDLSAPDGPGAPSAAAVVCHPHPLYGGDRRNPVVGAAVRGLLDVGAATLTFDFRGVGASEGVHGRGVDEVHDVAAALDEIAMRFPGVPLWLGGYSFGSIMAMSVADQRVAGWIGIAPPLAAMGGRPAAADDPRPVHLLVSGHDQFSPPDATAALTEGWAATTTTVLPSADHFLAGHLDAVARFVATAVAAT